MSRYINAGWLYGTLCNLWDKTDSEDFEKGVFETIINAPTADVVEVVYCKDCRWYKQKQKNLPYNQSKSYCNRSCVVATKENDFCSYGERSK